LQSDVDEKIGGAQACVQVQPLTHCNSAGEVYQRTASVQSQIEAALTLTSSQLIERAQISDDQAPDYFQEECLVYLIREFHKRGDEPLVNGLSEILLRRCKSMIYGRLQALGLQAVDDAFSDVIWDLFTLVLDLESGRGDFLQVRFRLALKSLIIAVYNRFVREMKKEAEHTVPLSCIAGNEPERDDGARNSIQPDDVVDPSISMEQRLLYREGLSSLNEPYRTTFILRYYEGWQIEAKDPSEPTLSRYFGRTPRTIHTWLIQAEQMLERWRGEQYEPEQ
jgi:DNA-directed RNA polymerase specialized sigma24 family protein